MLRFWCSRIRYKSRRTDYFITMRGHALKTTTESQQQAPGAATTESKLWRRVSQKATFVIYGCPGSDDGVPAAPPAALKAQCADAKGDKGGRNK